MNKPEWKDCPSWASWMAQDADGEWWAYEKKPVIRVSWNENFWFSGGDGRKKICNGSAIVPWAETLEQKPKQEARPSC